MAYERKEKKPVESAIITTEIVKKIQEKENLGLPLKLHERLWLGKTNVGVRKKGIKFAMTPEEIEEYVRCRLSVYYFAEHYCKIKLEDGTVNQMRLRDYQKDILKLYTENRYSILMASRQIGKCVDYNSIIKVMDSKTNETYNICIGRLYYELLKEKRRLTFLENIKLILYKILEIID